MQKVEDKNHLYMKDYTQDMISNLTLCSGCKKYKYKDTSSCDQCKSRIKSSKTVILCSKKDCKFKKSDLFTFPKGN